MYLEIVSHSKEKEVLVYIFNGQISFFKNLSLIVALRTTSGDVQNKKTKH